MFGACPAFWIPGIVLFRQPVPITHRPWVLLILTFGALFADSPRKWVMRLSRPDVPAVFQLSRHGPPNHQLLRPGWKAPLSRRIRKESPEGQDEEEPTTADRDRDRLTEEHDSGIQNAGHAPNIGTERPLVERQSVELGFPWERDRYESVGETTVLRPSARVAGRPSDCQGRLRSPTVRGQSSRLHPRNACRRSPESKRNEPERRETRTIKRDRTKSSTR